VKIVAKFSAGGAENTEQKVFRAGKGVLPMSLHKTVRFGANMRWHMRVAVFSLILLSKCGPLAIALCQVTSVSSTMPETSEKTKAALAKSLHSELVSAINKGQNLDDRLPNKTLRSYPADLTTKRVATRGPGGGTAVLRYKEAIARTEDVMRDSGLRVNVAIQALPSKCNIKYRPVIGGAELDAGQTDLSTDVDPRWYIFSCDCMAHPIEQRVDCTQDKKIIFRCRK